MNYYRPQGFSILPTVVKNLLIINGLFFLATIVLGNRFGFNLIETLGLHFPASEEFHPYQIITYMFMHGDFSHIFFNMFALWMFGSAIENHWGAKRFLTYYLITGIGSAVIHNIALYVDLKPTLDAIDTWLLNPSHEGLKEFLDSKYFVVTSQEIQEMVSVFVKKYNYSLIAGSDAQALQLATDFMLSYREAFLNAPVVVGASGSVFGLLLAFGMMFPNSLIYLYFFIPIKAKYFVILYGALEFFLGVTNMPGDNVAHFAHLGGMIFGFFLILYWRRNRRYY